jgi:uncharacterized membrane protein SirB2
MYTGILHTHLLSVILFLLLYLVKTYLLVSKKDEALEKITRISKHPERLISVLFLGTGIYLLINSGNVTPLVYIKIAMVFASIPLAVIGFKRKKPILAIASVLLLLGSYGLAEMNGKRGPSMNKPEADLSQASEAEVGKVLYANYCQNCHGPAGDAGLSGAKNLRTTALSADDQAKIITDGKGVMPGFKTLKSNEVDAIVKHVQTLK